MRFINLKDMAATNGQLKGEMSNRALVFKLNQHRAMMGETPRHAPLVTLNEKIEAERAVNRLNAKPAEPLPEPFWRRLRRWVME